MNSCNGLGVATVMLRVTIMTVLLLASIGKWRHRTVVAQTVGGVLGLRRRTAGLLLMVLLTVEVFLVGVVAAGYRPVETLWVTLLLFAMFTLYLVRAASGPNAAGCGCFDGSTEPVGPVEVVRNLFIMGFIGVALATRSVDQHCGGDALWSVPATTLLMAVVASGVLVLAYFLLIQAQTFFRHARTRGVARSSAPDRNRSAASLPTI